MYQLDVQGAYHLKIKSTMPNEKLSLKVYISMNIILEAKISFFKGNFM